MAREVTFEFSAFPTEGLRHGQLAPVPRRAGVFRIFDPNGNLILLEKTHNLAARLNRFYAETPRPGALDLREIGERVEFCATDSPFESLYLLYLERRRWFPSSYRRMRTFPLGYLLALDPAPRFPRIDVSRTIRPGIRYFGPFRSRKVAEQVRSTIERTFRIRPCEYDIQGNDPYPDCLYFQMRTCSRPCNGDIDRETYGEDIASAIAWILEDDGGAIAPLLARIGSLAGEMRFEEAEQIRLQVERVRTARAHIDGPIFEVGRFDHLAVLRSGSARTRKIAVIRSGRIARLEEHAVGDIADTLESSLAQRDAALRPGVDDFVYDEFCLAAGFLSRPLRSVRFFPLTSPPATAREVARELHSGPGDASPEAGPTSVPPV